MKQTNSHSRLFARLTAIFLIVCFVGGGLVLAQTKQLKTTTEPKVVTEVEEDDASNVPIQTQVPNGSSSYSVVIENKTQPDGKVIQSKKVWQNGQLVEETESELDGEDAQSALNATIQLPNGQIANGGVFQQDPFKGFLNDDDSDGDAFSGSPFDSIRRIEEQMRAQFDELRRQLAASAPGTYSPNPRLLQQGLAPQTQPSKFWIGLNVSPVPAILVSQLPIEENEGVLVEFVAPNSPAEKAGLKRYDVLISINGEKTNQLDDVVNLVEKAGANKVEIQYYRKGKLEKADATIEERPAQLTQQLTPNAGINKNFRVVRPGLIVPQSALDSEEAESNADASATTEEKAPENE